MAQLLVFQSDELRDSYTVCVGVQVMCFGERRRKAENYARGC